MRLVVDARSLLPVQPGLGVTGVGRWTAGAVGALATRTPDWDIDLVLIHRTDAIDTNAFPPNVSFRPVRFSERWQRRLTVFGLWPAIDRFVGRPDALLGPGFVTWRSGGAEMPVIHDLTHVRYPDYVSPRNLVFMKAVLGRSVKRASVIVTVSEAMRAEIATHYGIGSERIVVVPNGVHPELFDSSPRADLPAGIPHEFVLSVGTKEPRKNLTGTLAAYEVARRALGDALPPLVIVGGRGWRDSEINALLAQMPEGSIVETGYVDDAVLFALYRRATALLFPTFYEGFGLPVLEAMACGCPVVTASVGGIPEVAGDAAVYVDPADAIDIARGLEEVVTNEVLRARLVETARSRAEAFTWDAAGAALQRAVERAVHG